MLNQITWPNLADYVVIHNEKVKATTLDEEFLIRLYEVLAIKAFDSRYSVPRLCRDMGISSSHLHRKLIALTGKPVVEMIATMRMEKARQLLQTQTRLSIADIAFDCGFHDPDYFSRAFSRRFGVSPGKFRKQM